MMFIPIVEDELPFGKWLVSVASHNVESPRTFLSASAIRVCGQKIILCPKQNFRIFYFATSGTRTKDPSCTDPPWLLLFSELSVQLIILTIQLCK